MAADDHSTIEDVEYTVSDDHRRQFAEQGYVHLAGLLTEDEVAEIAVDYDRFLRREIEVPGKDYCDMAGDYGRDPSRLLDRQRDAAPPLLPGLGRATSYERRAASVARAALRRRHGARLRPAARQAALQGRRGVRLAPGHGVLARHARHPHGHHLAGDRRLDGRERVHALRPRHDPRAGAAAARAAVRRPRHLARARHRPARRRRRRRRCRSAAATARCTTSA